MLLRLLDEELLLRFVVVCELLLLLLLFINDELLLRNEVVLPRPMLCEVRLVTFPPRKLVD